jgi:hypothetical protein
METAEFATELSQERQFIKALNATAKSELSFHYDEVWWRINKAIEQNYGVNGWDSLYKWFYTPIQHSYKCMPNPQEFPWIQQIKPAENEPERKFNGVSPIAKMEWILKELKPAFQTTLPWFIETIHHHFGSLFSSFNSGNLEGITSQFVRDAEASLQSVNESVSDAILADYASQDPKYHKQIKELLERAEKGGQILGVTRQRLEWMMAEFKGFKVPNPYFQVQTNAAVEAIGENSAIMDEYNPQSKVAQITELERGAETRGALAEDPRLQATLENMNNDHKRTVELMHQMQQTQDGFIEKIRDVNSKQTLDEIQRENLRYVNLDNATQTLREAANAIKTTLPKLLDPKTSAEQQESFKASIKETLLPLTDALKDAPAKFDEPVARIAAAAEAIQKGGTEASSAVQKLIDNSDVILKGIQTELSKERNFKVELDQTELKKVVETIISIKRSFEELSSKADKRLDSTTAAIKSQFDLVTTKLQNVLEEVVTKGGEQQSSLLRQLSYTFEEFKSFAEKREKDSIELVRSANKQVQQLVEQQSKLISETQKETRSAVEALTNATQKDLLQVEKLQSVLERADTRYEALIKKENETLSQVERDRKQGYEEWTKGLTALRDFTQRSYETQKLTLETQASTMSSSMKEMILASQTDREKFLQQFETKKKEKTETDILMAKMEKQSQLQATQIEKLIEAIKQKNAAAPAKVEVGELAIVQNNRPTLLDASGRDPGVPSTWLDDLSELDKVAQSLGSNLFVPVNTRFLAGKDPAPAPTSLLDYNKKIMEEAKNSASNVKCDQKYTLPWEKSNGCGWFDSDKEKLKYQINWLRNHLGLVPLRWAETWIPVDNYADLVEGYLDEIEQAPMLAQFRSKVNQWLSKRLNHRLDNGHLSSFWSKLIDLEMQLALQRKEKRFRKRLIQWVLGNGVRGEYKDCFWIPKDEQDKPALFSKLQAFFTPEKQLSENNLLYTKWKTYLIDRNPDILWGMVEKYNEHRKKKQQFLTTLQRTVPKNDEELYLFYKYVVKKKLLAKFNERARNDTPYPADTPKRNVSETVTTDLITQLYKSQQPSTVQEMGRRLFELKFEGPKKNKWAKKNEKKLVEQGPEEEMEED